MMVYRASSINLDRSVEEQRKTEIEIQRRVPEVTHVFSRIGSAEIATDPMPPSDCDFYIYYKPQKQWRKTNGRTISKDDLAKIISTEIEQLNPGARVMVRNRLRCALTKCSKAFVPTSRSRFSETTMTNWSGWVRK